MCSSDLVLGLSLLAPACVGGGTGVRVVAALYPLAWVAERVGGAWVEVEDVTPPGTEAHDATLSAAQRADLRLLFLCVILGLTSWTGLARLLRGEALKLRELEYVQAAQAFGDAVADHRVVLDQQQSHGPLLQTG